MACVAVDVRRLSVDSGGSLPLHWLTRISAHASVMIRLLPQMCDGSAAWRLRPEYDACTAANSVMPDTLIAVADERGDPRHWLQNSSASKRGKNTGIHVLVPQAVSQQDAGEFRSTMPDGRVHQQACVRKSRSATVCRGSPAAYRTFVVPSSPERWPTGHQCSVRVVCAR